jgi:ComF family protein
MLDRLLAMLAPPTCCACAAAAVAGAPLCAGCASAMRRARPAVVAVAGLDWAVAAAPYDGIGGALVAALKFRGRLALAAPIAAAIATAAGARLAGATLVAVPAAPRRRRRRGFDPAEEISRALARGAALPRSQCLVRADGPRQVGRARRERLAAPPLVRARGAAPERAVLVDDVVTTGATLAACGAALRRNGSREVGAVAFARSGDCEPRGISVRSPVPA